MPGLRIVTHDGWRGNKKLSAKAVDRWGQSMEITWLIDPEDATSSSPSASSNDLSRASHPSPSSGDTKSDSDSINVSLGVRTRAVQPLSYFLLATVLLINRIDLNEALMTQNGLGA